MKTQDQHATPDFSRLVAFLNAPVKHYQHLLGILAVTLLVGGPFAMAGGLTSAGGSAPTNAQISAVAAPLVITGTSDTTQLKIKANATQTTVPFALYASDGTTKKTTIDPSGSLATWGLNHTAVNSEAQFGVSGNNAIIDAANHQLLVGTPTAFIGIGGSQIQISTVNGTMLFQDKNGTAIAAQSSGSFAAEGVTAVKSAAYTAVKTDSLVLADPNAAAGSFAITLPAANAAKGQLLCVKVVATHASRVITVIRAGADTINATIAGATTVTFTTTANLASACFQSDGTSVWEMTATNGTVASS